MKFVYKTRRLWMAVLLGSLVACVYFSYSGVGAGELEHPEGISIREGSPQGRRGFFMYYGGRSRRGGGPFSGK